MSNTVFSANKYADMENLVEVDLDEVDVVEAVAEVKGEDLSTVYQKRASEVVRTVNALKQEAMKNLPTSDEFTKKVAAKAKKVAHCPMIPRTNRTYSSAPTKGRKIMFAGKEVFPHINRWHFAVCPVGGRVIPFIMKAIQNAGVESTLPEAAFNSTKYLYASGPVEGFVGRYLEGCNRPKSYKFDQADVQYVLDDLQFKAGLARLSDENFESMRRTVRVNLNASAGYPYDVSKDSTVTITASDGKRKAVELISIITADARRYWQACCDERSNHAIEKFYAADPGHRVFQLKNKFERVEVGKLTEKIRPYYVPPAAPSLVWMMFGQFLSLNTRTFFDIIESDDLDMWDSTSNCVGISWTNGGCSKFWRAIFRLPEGRFLPLAYTDDGLWIFHLNSRFFAVCVDIEQLDQSLSGDFGQLAHHVIKEGWAFVTDRETSEFPAFWENALRDNCYHAFYGAYVAFKEVVLQHEGLHSGVPLTTFFNEVAASLLNGKLKERVADLDLPEPGDEHEFIDRVLDIAREIAAKHGLKYKEATMKPIEIWPDNLTGVEFLGMQFDAEVSENGIEYYPRIPEDKVLSVLWAERPVSVPKLVKDAEMYQRRVLMERLRAYTLIGGYAYPETNTLLRQQFENLVMEWQLKPLLDTFELDEEYALLPEVGRSLLELNIGDTPVFPSVEWCRAVYSGADRSKLRKVGEEYSYGKEMPQLAKAKSFWADDGPEDAVKQRINDPLPTVPQKWKNQPPRVVLPPPKEEPVVPDEDVQKVVHNWKSGGAQAPTMEALMGMMQMLLEERGKTVAPPPPQNTSRGPRQPSNTTTVNRPPPHRQDQSANRGGPSDRRGRGPWRGRRGAGRGASKSPPPSDS